MRHGHRLNVGQPSAVYTLRSDSSVLLLPWLSLVLGLITVRLNWYQSRALETGLDCSLSIFFLTCLFYINTTGQMRIQDLKVLLRHSVRSGYHKCRMKIHTTILSFLPKLQYCKTVEKSATSEDEFHSAFSYTVFHTNAQNIVEVYKPKQYNKWCTEEEKEICHYECACIGITSIF